MKKVYDSFRFFLELFTGKKSSPETAEHTSEKASPSPPEKDEKQLKQKNTPGTGNKRRKKKKPVQRPKGPGKCSNVRPEMTDENRKFEAMVGKSLREMDISAFKPDDEPEPTVHEKMNTAPQPQKTLDLHGMTSSTAEQKITWFIENCAHEGIRTVRVITGRGRHSASGPVLRNTADIILAALKRNHVIIAYRWDRGTKEKSGAVTVYIS